MSYTTIEPEELYKLWQQNNDLTLIDVRTPVEYAELHASIAYNVPLDKLNPIADNEENQQQVIYVICRTGSRGEQACKKFIEAGFTETVNVRGGTLAWQTAGLPVEQNKEIMSLERQVRIAAGLLVFTGSLLAHFVSPNWIALPGLVGAGLIFAGLTNYCGMGMLLAKMPWNSCSGSCQGCSSNEPCGQ